VTVLRSLFALRSPAGRRGRLTILIFHRVLARPDPLFPEEVDAARFDTVCGWLADWFNVLPLGDAAVRLKEGRLPARAAAITFDDGYADNHDVALPILKRHALPATFFIASGFLDGGRMFNDSVIEAVRRASTPALDLRDLDLGLGAELPIAHAGERRVAIERLLGVVKYLPLVRRDSVVGELARRSGALLPTDLMMRSAQVRALHDQGMTIGAHTRSHPILANLSPALAEEEIVAGRDRLQDIVGAPITLFAYPNGKPDVDYHAGTAALVRELGFEAAVTTAWGAAAAGSDRYQLPRFSPWDLGELRFGWRLLQNYNRTPTVGGSVPSRSAR
jgi:peptidoglycan/xylan/chitin deacetylase (PgdA/CDA1 family)